MTHRNNKKKKQPFLAKIFGIRNLKALNKS